MKELRKFEFKQIKEITDEMVQEIFISEKEKNDILCRTCKNKISAIDKMIEIDGKHKHTFKNPIGIAFEIGCFLTASGCTVLGTPTLEHSWFSGLSWNFALCSHCFSHLGWYFQSSKESFFGLILENLIENSATH
ncbi:MAG: hypothetical protein KAT17_07955 [Candidatus Aminicenantes bacterium]|nr:hypothetical protein [Candidatus Aminicenantes bacterium]